MDTARLLKEVEDEILRLEKVRDLLRGDGKPSKRGRKAGTRKLSAKARRAISAAQKARWAKVRASKKAA